MMGGKISRQNLLKILGTLLLVKFVLVPIHDWQNSKIEELHAKKQRLQRLTDVVESHASYHEILAMILTDLRQSEQFFYVDDDSTKLKIQRDLEELFQGNDLEVTGFNWVIDSEGSQRVLRATLFFKGPTDNMIETFWAMARWPRLIKIIEWSQQMAGNRGVDSGWTQGNVTLEFYARNTHFDAEQVAMLAIPFVGN